MKEYPHQPLSQADYDPALPMLFQEEKKKIEASLGDQIIRIEHIGSTAVPGLSGKPIIDILIVIDSENSAAKCLEALQYLDYQYVDQPDQYYLRKSTTRTGGFHVHMTTLDNKFWRERIAFRDYLRNHPEVRDEYANLKQKLIKQFGDNKIAYREGKRNFMATITKKALKEK